MGAGVGLWIALIVGAIVVGPSLLGDKPSPRAAPLMGEWEWGASLAVVAPVCLAACTVVFGPRLAASLPWRWLLLGAGVTTMVWSVALAAVDGWHRIAEPLSVSFEYLAVVDRVEDPGSFLRTYTAQLDSYPIHVQGHPPGMPLLYWWLERLGLGGAGWAAGVVLAGAGGATAAALVAVRGVGREQMARRAAPFVAVAPAAVWLGTSTDAFFSGVIAVGIAGLVAGTGWRVHLASGAVLGWALHLSYGAVPLLLLPAAVWIVRRRYAPLAWAALGAATVTVGFAAAGFWWLDGLAATHEAYETGISERRPYWAFTLLLNPAALALAAGPAVAAGFAMWAHSAARLGQGVAPLARQWLVPLTALLAVGLANLSGLSKGEVERIWLPFMPWLLVIAAGLPRARPWLGGQVGLALALQLGLRSPW
jgi:hypothetical protein